MREVLARGERIMGMGHREYKVRDPRAQHLEAVAKTLSELNDPKWYKIARSLDASYGLVTSVAREGNCCALAVAAVRRGLRSEFCVAIKGVVFAARENK